MLWLPEFSNQADRARECVPDQFNRHEDESARQANAELIHHHLAGSHRADGKTRTRPLAGGAPVVRLWGFQGATLSRVASWPQASNRWRAMMTCTASVKVTATRKGVRVKSIRLNRSLTYNLLACQIAGGISYATLSRAVAAAAAAPSLLSSLSSCSSNFLTSSGCSK